MSETMFTTSLGASISATVLAHLLFIIGFLLALTAIFSPGQHREMGLVALLVPLLGSMLLSKQRAFAVDWRRQRYCHCLLFFGLPIGRWQPLPPVARVVLKPYSEYQRPTEGRGSMGVWQTTWALKSCIVLLSVEASSQGIVVGKAHAAREAEARQIARQLAAYLGVGLWEAD